jgi:hypothetical protein
MSSKGDETTNNKGYVMTRRIFTKLSLLSLSILIWGCPDDSGTKKKLELQKELLELRDYITDEGDDDKYRNACLRYLWLKETIELGTY